jgi:aminobenzoyl-glutamate transport protein
MPLRGWGTGYYLTPLWIFVYLALVVILLWWVFSLLGIVAVDTGTKEVGAHQEPDLRSTAGYILTSVVDNFIYFPPLGTVLTLIFGIGLAQTVGLVENAMQKMITNNRDC